MAFAKTAEITGIFRRSRRAPIEPQGFQWRFEGCMLGATLGVQEKSSIFFEPQEGSVAVAIYAMGFSYEIKTLSQEELSDVNK